MMMKFKKFIITFIIFSLSIICLIAPSFATIEFGISEDDLPDLNNIGASVKETMQQEKIVWHNGRTLNIVRDDEIDKTKLTQTEYLQVIKDFTALKNNCTCISDYTNISHFGHSGCSLSDKWEKRARNCTHRTQWEELFRKFATKTTSYGYYSFNCSWGTLKANLESWIKNANEYYSITEIMDFLNDEDFDLNQGTSTGYYLLQYNSSFFCAKHGQAIGRHHNYFCRDHQTLKTDMFTKITTTGNTFDTYRVYRYTPLTDSETFDYMDQDHEDYDTRTVRSNTKYFLDTTYRQSLTKTQNTYEIFNGFGTYNTNVFTYALSYSQKYLESYQGSNYKNERAQLAIWAVVGNPGYGEPRTDTIVDYNEDEFENVDEDDETTTDISKIINSGLYKAAGAVDEYEDILVEDLVSSDISSHIRNGASEATARHMVAVEGSNKRIKNNPEVYKQSGNTNNVSSGLGIGQNASEPTGTTIFYENGEYYYRIGPFKMNDYALAEAKSNVPVQDYSGYGLDYPKLVGGIISGTVSFGNDSNSNTTKVTIGNGSGKARIEYKDALGNATSQGVSYSGNYIKKPSTSSYPYPYPESIFYIVVAKDDCGTNATKLVDISFEYRQTKTDGNGWIVKSKYIQTTFQRIAENPNPDTVCNKYYCTGSGGSGCYNNEITYTSRATLGVSHPYYCSEYKNGTKYCYKGTKNCKTHCGGDCNTCGHDCNCKDKCTHSCSSSSLNYCAHGYYQGKHNNYKYTWGAAAPTTCSHQTKCNAHNHEDCYNTHWEEYSQGPIAGQPFLAVRDAFVEVVKMKVTTPGINIRLTTDITIDKYIYNVDHTKTGTASGHSSYREYDNAYDSDKFSNSTERALKSDDDKSKDFLKVERGDEITYKIVLTNSSSIDVDVQVKDVLPNYCKYQSVDVGLAKNSTNASAGQKFFVTEWLTVPKKQGSTPGKTTITVKIIATASGERDVWDEIITNQNEATLVSSNAGRRVSGSTVGKNDDHINYVRLNGSTNGMECGAVVNLAQLDGSNVAKVLDSSDFYRVKSYNIVLDKYITKVEHVTTGEETYHRSLGSLNLTTGAWTKADESYADRDLYNDADYIEGETVRKKYDNPIYVEYGDRVTYDIDIQNTWDANNKEINQKSSRDETINTSPYYAPNYVKVDIVDQLPDCYQEGSLKIEYIVHQTGYGNDKDGKTDSHGSFTRYIITENTSQSSVSRISTSAGNVYVNLYNGTVTVNNLYINPCSEATLRISFIVDTNQTGTKYENNARLMEIEGGAAGNYLDYAIKNINEYYVFNTTNKYDEDGTKAPLRVNTSDFFMLNDYNSKIDKFISKYNEEILNENISNNFEEDYTTDLSGREMQSNSYRSNRPVSVEKYETLQYTIKVYNDSKAQNKTSSTGKYYKPQTTVRPSSVRDTLDYGLELKTDTVRAVIKNSDGSVYNNIGKIQPTSVGAGRRTYDFNINNIENNKWTVLQPGQYIEYTMTVEVTRSNMYLYNLRNTANINVLTDINNISNNADNNPTLSGPKANEDNTGYDHTRMVTERNTSTRKSSSDYVKLKDLIISGKVWLDIDKNGYMPSYNGMASLHTGNSSNVGTKTEDEKVMAGIIVRLYRTDQDEPVRTTVTDSNGLYTFARQENSSDYRKGLEQRVDKATNKNSYGNYQSSSKYINYFIEFEYDGVLYKATEQYGGFNEEGDSSGTGKLRNYGDGNLNSSWRASNYGDTQKSYKTDSNASEFTDVRERFNKSHQTVSYDKAYSFSGTTFTDGITGSKEIGTEYDLGFTKENHQSYLNIDHDRIPEDDKEFKDMTARSFILQNSNESIENTNTLWLFESSKSGSTKQFSNTNLPETEYLKYINLGLEEREDADISLTKDVYEVKTTINGEEMTYSYDRNKGINGEMVEAGEEGFLQDYQIKKPYGLTLYEADFKYRHTQYQNKEVQIYKGNESELNVEVTYRITVNNNKVEENVMTNSGLEDIPLSIRVHEIVDLYDKDFIKFKDNMEETIRVRQKEENSEQFKTEDKKIKIAEAWYYEDNDIEGDKKYLHLSNSSKYSYKENNFTEEENGEYNTLYISGMDNFEIEEGERLDIYVKYVLDKDTHKTDEKTPDDGSKELDKENKDAHIEPYELIGNLQIGDKKLDSRGTENIAQINAYSIWYKDGGKPTSIVERDSNAGNIGIDNDGNSISADDTEYYEDTVYKTGIDIASPNSPNPPIGNGAIIEDEDVLDPVRTISGTVWDDSRSESTKMFTDTDIIEDELQYYGNGRFNGFDKEDEDGNFIAADKKVNSAKMNQSVTDNYRESYVTEERDITVTGAKVEFIEIVEVPVDGQIRYYEEKLQDVDWNYVQNSRTDEEGNYLLSGFIPGYYIVRYTYGDTTTDENKENMLIFNGQDYKSTMYTGVSDEEDDYDIILKKMQEKDYSDARDDEIRRLETIAYSETMVNEKAEVLKGLESDAIERLKTESLSDDEKAKLETEIESQQNALTDNTYMYADTVKFYVKPEKLRILTNPDELNIRDSYLKYFNTSTNMLYKELLDVDFLDTTVRSREFAIEDLDFGIEYRPESQITLNKEISGISLITSDGTELVNLVIDTRNFGSGTKQEHKINKEKSKGLEYTQFISNEYKTIDPYKLTSEDYQGFVFINVEEEILQGSTIEIEYSFIAENNSENDRISKELSKLRYRENIAGMYTAERSADYQNYEDKYFAYLKLYTESNVDASKELGDGQLYKTSDIETYKEKYNNNPATTNVEEYVYTAAGTAVNLLKEKDLYKEYDDSYGGKYTLKEKKLGDYYGKYLGEFYYTGTVGSDDVISSLKFDKILDYVDTDLVFNPNLTVRQENNLWSATSDKKLKNIFIKEEAFKSNSETEEPKLVNASGIGYVTYQDGSVVTSNLIMSIDDRVKDQEYYLEAANQGKSEAEIASLGLEVKDPTINLGLSKYVLPKYSSDSSLLTDLGSIVTETEELLGESLSSNLINDIFSYIKLYVNRYNQIEEFTSLSNSRVEALSNLKDDKDEILDSIEDKKQTLGLVEKTLERDLLILEKAELERKLANIGQVENETRRNKLKIKLEEMISSRENQINVLTEKIDGDDGIKDELTEFKNDKKSSLENLANNISNKKEELINEEETKRNEIIESIYKSIAKEIVGKESDLTEDEEEKVYAILDLYEDEIEKLYTGKVLLTVSKVISAESADTDDLKYENIAEVIQFTSQTGRRTNYATTIGNAEAGHKDGEFSVAITESDTTATEVITLTPPTGLDRLNRVVRDTIETAGVGIVISVVVIALIIGGFLIVKLSIKKIKKRPIK